MRTKICGITRLEDAEVAADAGAWAIGLNHYSESPRLVSREQAELIGAAMKRRCEVAGIFVNATLGEIAAAADRAQLTLVQLHGDEGPSFCAEVSRRTGAKVIKAFRVRSQAEIRGAATYRTDFHLFDAYRPGSPGGTGESFDWALVGTRGAGIPAIVAGGLTPENVAEAITASNPWGVDVAGGVESAPGVKDHARVREFIEAANEAGRSLAPESGPERTPEGNHDGASETAPEPAS